MKSKKFKRETNFVSSKNGRRGIPTGEKITQDTQNDSTDDLIIGNMVDLNKKESTKKTLPKVVQIRRDLRKLRKEKAIISKMDSEDREKTEHLLQVHKAMLKSKGEKVYDEKSLNKRRKSILKKKNKSRKRWEEKLSKERGTKR
ncbi:hypothetical protein, conserved [Plasmodium gonderi]|uniref:Ribosomal RNA-processing protein 14/surfeit locus protein 6 C-terminal domain-containing protein n=1 Tax=Plasmodium gonderi TaxID=77519 RepID=A0A1Y1JFB9_PLAGO|nr:hypothetical protein, conserved [Plasmodium gonderi]GAW80348.1 hypothetical protein, conserved [Plasmodium gonderi]